MEVLRPFRTRIDALDDRIVDLLAERMDIVREVGMVKARENIATIQELRVNEVRERCAARGMQKGLNPGMVRKIYTVIIDEAHEIEQALSSKS
jgi:4-amino-4-deoxychorismate mutase